MKIKPSIFSTLILLLGFPTGIFAVEKNSAGNAFTFSTSPSESVLLLDDHAVARTKNLTQKFFPAGKHPANPVMRRSEPWEGVGPYVFCNRLIQDEKTGQLRLWYVGHRPPIEYAMGYATSFDGLKWTKPDLAVCRVGDKSALNCIVPDRNADGTGSFVRDPRPETPSHRRYMGVKFTYDGECASFSADGIVWRNYASNPVWRVPADAIHLMWDERRQKFVGFYKVWELIGKEVKPGGPAEGVPFIAHMPTFTPKDLGNGTAEFEGPRITFRAPESATVETQKFILRSGKQGADDGGGVSLSGEWNAKRVQAFAESNDGIHWSNEQVILRADEKDPPTANIQIMFVIPYGGYYLGFLTLHDEAGYFRIHLAWSADGLKWQRPTSRVPWLDVGAQGSFDSGMILGPVDPIFWEKEMWFPYGGFDILHNSPRQDFESALGMATTRLDGFAAWEAGNESGELVTQPFVCNGDRLFVNANAKNGSVAVEVLDEKGNALKGLETKSCRAITTDTLEKGGWIQWKKEKDLRRVQGKQIQLRFTLKNAKLYSFRVADEKTMKLSVPRATTR
ncbi:MAG: hypothetical protein ABJC04_07760 [Verrucomicrobiota bacterium]